MVQFGPLGYCCDRRQRDQRGGAAADASDIVEREIPNDHPARDEGTSGLCSVGGEGRIEADAGNRGKSGTGGTGGERSGFPSHDGTKRPTIDDRKSSYWAGGTNRH